MADVLDTPELFKSSSSTESSVDDDRRPRKESAHSISADDLPAPKLADFDDLWDVYFHRPAAGIVLDWLLGVQRKFGIGKEEGITPNQITLLSTLVGFWGARCMYVGLAEGSCMQLSAAGFLIMLACVLDCMDGQLARRLSTPNPLGKYVDGVGDLAMMVSLTVGLCAGFHVSHGPAWFWLAFATSICMQQHFILFDKVCFTTRIQGQPLEQVKKTLAECDYSIVCAQRVQAYEKGDWFAWFIWGFAGFYTQSLDICSRKVAQMRSLARSIDVEQRNQALKRLTPLGMGTTMLFYYGALSLGSVWLVKLFIAFQLTVSVAYQIWVVKQCQAAALYVGKYSELVSIVPYTVIAVCLDMYLRME